MLNKKEVPSQDAETLLRRENKIIMAGRGREEPGWKMGGGKKRGVGSGMEGDRRKSQRAGRMNGNKHLRGAPLKSPRDLE